MLVDPDNLLKNSVTIPEGLRVDRHRRRCWPRSTDFSAREVREGARRPRRARPAALRPRQRGGLPLPGDLRLRARTRRRRSILRDMVDALEAGRRRRRPRGRRAKRLGYTPGRADDGRQPGRRPRAGGDDMPKIARVIYNRLEGDETNGLLQIDATVNYAPDNQKLARRRRPTTCSRLAVQHLPQPGPAADADRGARGRRAQGGDRTRPTGGWYYYVTVNLQHRRDEVHHDLRRVPPVQGRAAAATAQTESDGVLSRRGRDEVRRAGRPDRPLAVAGAAPGGRTPRSAWTGPTTPQRVAEAGAGRRSSPAWTPRGAGCR